MDDTRWAWWKDTAERLVWTFLQGAIAVFTATELGWVELGDGDLWKTAALGGLAASLSLFKSLVAAQVSTGNTAQLGAHTYSYTATGPGAAGGDLADAGAVTLRDAMIFVALGLAIVALVIWIF